MDRPAIRDAGIAVTAGRVLGCARLSDLRRAHPAAEIEELGDVIVLPGLINAHVHLELSDFESGDSPGGSFTDWILGIRSRMRLGERDIQDAAAAATRHGIEQSLRFGVTTVGDITSHIEDSRRELADSPIGGVSFGEVLGLGPQRTRAESSLDRAIQQEFTSDRLRIGVTPHAPYTVDLDMFQTCIDTARDRRMPLATHLAESPDEQEFLVHQSGPFRAVWDSIGQWDGAIKTFPGRPIEMAHAIGLLDAGALLAHVNYCNDDELGLLARGRASVVWCPRTHRYFGHPPHRWRDMLAAGINVAVGTDSCASSPDLNILGDLRRLRELAPDLPARAIFELATTRAARALGLQGSVGSLATGSRADFVAFAAHGAEPLDNLLTTRALPTATWIAGAAIDPLA
jgi:cytosine/adenosine deaminase-related metal-dependent hydrolase